MLTMGRHQVIDILVSRDGPNCFLCQKSFDNEKPTLDHWIPRYRGGSHNIENLRLMHRQCNLDKGNLMPNPDGTIPEKPRRPGINSYAANQRKKEIIAAICPECQDGRMLRENELCTSCGQPPGPAHAPIYLKRRSPECDHSIFWCWACSIGIVERKQAIMELMVGDGTVSS
mgnify:FL=1